MKKNPPRLIPLFYVLVVAAFLLAFPAAGRALSTDDAVETLRAGPVTVIYDSGQAGTAKRAAREALKVLDRLRSDFGLTGPEHFQIRLVQSEIAMRSALPHGLRAPSWAAGVAVPSMQLIVVRNRPAVEQEEFDRVVAHETVHLVLGYNLGPREDDAPTWLNEGLTMQLSDDFGLDRQLAMFRALVSNRVIPLERLHHGFPDDRIDAETAYAESYYLIAFLRAQYGRQALGRLVRLMSLGAAPEIALLNVTGKTEKDLEVAFDGWIRKRFSILWLITGPGGLWFLAAILLLAAFLLRRRASRRKLAEWEAEDGPEGDIGWSGRDRQTGGPGDSI